MYPFDHIPRLNNGTDWKQPDLVSPVLYALKRRDPAAFLLSITREPARHVLSVIQDVCRSLIHPVSSRVTHVPQMLDYQNAREQDHCPCDRALRHDLFKLLKTLSEVKKVFPPQLHLEGVECTDYDRQNAINTMGGFSDVHYGKYRGNPVALKKLRMMGSDRHTNDFFLVGVTPFKSISSRILIMLVKALPKEALKWRQFSHKNILPFLGLDMATFQNHACMISPWMDNGNIRQCRDRLKDDGLDIPVVQWVCLMHICQTTWNCQPHGLRNFSCRK